MLAGCRQDSADEKPRAAVVETKLTKVSDSADAAPQGPQIFVVRIKIVTIEVPIGLAGAAKELWWQLDEDNVRMIRPALLADNGLRVGLGQKAKWPQVAKTLSALTGQKIWESIVLIRPGDPGQIEVKQKVQAQTIFVVNEDGTLAGRDYPPADNLLSYVCTIDQENPTHVTITVVPQIRQLQFQPEIVLQEGRYMMTSRPLTFSLSPLTFQATLPAEDFIVISPAAAGQYYTAGHHFLAKEKNGVEFETVLVLVPEVFRAPAPRAGGE